ncbi:MAG: hypothetical protein IJ733_03570 [Lachnospiraceae bacterium]|nr:hypothetical protein [Lachnospiraceae bacterium]
MRDFIKKPFVPKVLTLRVRHTIDLDYLQKNLKEEVEKKTKENERLFLHDVGKIGVPDAVINKPAKLIDEDTEYKMKEE